jgi:Bifunctional DNA primase/polymerase, N-terminal
MTTNSPEAALDEALRLAAYGLPCFPCLLPKKRPTCKRGFKDATADADALRELWRQSPGDLVGVPTGEPSGLFVVDIDSARHPEAGDWLERNRVRLPETRQHQTISGGLHLIFKHPGMGNTTSKLARGVDTRGDGGYIIWWPAHLDLGAKHKLVPSAPVPGWLIEALQPPRVIPFPRALVHMPRTDDAMTRRKLEGLIAAVAGAREGERNSLTFWAACRVHEMIDNGELSKPEASDALTAIALAAERAGLAPFEIRRTINSALRQQA